MTSTTGDIVAVSVVLVSFSFRGNTKTQLNIIPNRSLSKAVITVREGLLLPWIKVDMTQPYTKNGANSRKTWVQGTFSVMTFVLLFTNCSSVLGIKVFVSTYGTDVSMVYRTVPEKHCRFWVLPRVPVTVQWAVEFSVTTELTVKTKPQTGR